MTIETRNAEKFWIWAELNRARIRETLKAARRSIPGVHIVLVEPLIDEMTRELHAYDERLTPLIALAKDDVLELTVTAEAQPEAFGAVKALMSLAPVSPAWRFFALRRRRSVEHALLDGRELRGVENIRFACGLASRRASVTLIVDDALATSVNKLQAAGAHVVQAIIGEEDYGLHEVGVAVVTATVWRAHRPDVEPRPLAELSECFDRMFALEDLRVA